MGYLYEAIVVLHFVGLASLLGGFLVPMRERPHRVNTAMFHGALTQLVTGVALVGIAEATADYELNHAKIAIKLGVLLVITGLVVVNRKKESVSTAVWAAIGGLTLLNVVIAVFV